MDRQTYDNRRFAAAEAPSRGAQRRCRASQVRGNTGVPAGARVPGAAGCDEVAAPAGRWGVRRWFGMRSRCRGGTGSPPAAGVERPCLHAGFRRGETVRGGAGRVGPVLAYRAHTLMPREGTSLCPGGATPRGRGRGCGSGCVVSHRERPAPKGRGGTGRAALPRLPVDRRGVSHPHSRRAPFGARAGEPSAPIAQRRRERCPKARVPIQALASGVAIP